MADTDYLIHPKTDEEIMQTCSYCVMDTTDPAIVFDENGRCNHCCKAAKRLKDMPRKGLAELVSQIKKRGGQYNCIIGVSGGVDSTYLAYIAKKELGLNPLAVHLDNGWNSALATANIEKALKKLDIDLFTYVIDWTEFRDIQLAFLRASTPDSEIPTDHAITSLLYKVAVREKVPYILSGSNIATECIMPPDWSRGHVDWKYIKSVHNLFGVKPIRTFPHRSLVGEWYYRVVRKIKRVNLLDYIDYNKARAIKILENELGWQSYGQKHYESIYTRFFQSYILPKKFNFDKRKGHLSSLIVSGQMTRDEAVKELQVPPYDEGLVGAEMECVAEKLGISVQEFDEIMALPVKNFFDYPSYERSWYYKFVLWLYRFLKKIKLAI